MSCSRERCADAPHCKIAGTVRIRPGFQFGSEQLSIEQLVTQPTVEAFHEAVLPGGSRLNVARVDVQVAEMTLDSLGDKLGTIVGAHILWPGSLLEETVQLSRDILSRDASCNQDSEAFPSVFIDDRHDLQLPTILGAVVEEVVASRSTYGA